MAIYLKKFSTIAEYEAYITSEDKVLPNVSICTNEGGVHYNPYVPPHDYSKDYFTMLVTTSGDIKWRGVREDNTLSYSKDNGDNWSAVTSADTISVVEGDKVLWKGTPTPRAEPSKGIGKFSGTTDVRYSIEGNAMSLLFGDDFKTETSLKDKTHALYGLFSGNTNVTSAENLSLPATRLETDCYCQMFKGCTSLTAAPSVLPATTLAISCYTQMFQDCTSLATVPELPATTLIDNCYESMFWGCTSLTTAPELPATTLAISCYRNMFTNCTSLTAAPSVLPATTLAESCYNGMFGNCTSLAAAPTILSATTLTSYCYMNMFNGCTSLTTAPELPATTLTMMCYYGMFSGCTSLNSIKCLATNIGGQTNLTTASWVSGVASSGTFTKAASMTSWTTGSSGIPSGWAIVDEA